MTPQGYLEVDYDGTVIGITQDPDGFWPVIPLYSKPQMQAAHDPLIIEALSSTINCIDAAAQDRPNAFSAVSPYFSDLREVVKKALTTAQAK
jgi:hypothetical protein